VPPLPNAASAPAVVCPLLLSAFLRLLLLLLLLLLLRLLLLLLLQLQPGEEVGSGGRDPLFHEIWGRPLLFQLLPQNQQLPLDLAGGGMGCRNSKRRGLNKRN
jgi:hypothetical protein